jgi:hypothetical protein
MFCHYAVVLCFGCIFSYPLVNLLHVALGVICVLVSGLSLTLRFGDCQFPFLPPQSFQIPCRLVRPIQAMLARTFDQKKNLPVHCCYPIIEACAPRKAIFLDI